MTALTIRMGTANTPPADLQAAINAATPGATINATGGSYSGAFTVNKALTIIGGTLTLPLGSQALLDITGTNVVLDGMTLTGAGAGSAQNEYASGVWTDAATNLEVKNCTITNFRYGGVMIWSTSGANIHDNYIGQIAPGEVSEGNAYGIAFSDFGDPVSSDCVADTNVIEDIPTWQGINTHNGLRITISNNTMRRVRRGIWLASPAGRPSPTDCIVTGNRLEDPEVASQTGIFLSETVGSYVHDNQISLSYSPSGGDYINYVRDYGSASTGYSISGNTTFSP